MKVQTGETYTSAEYAKSFIGADAKHGKTTFILASLLGILPWQRFGGVVDDPSHIHVLTFDSSALSGFSNFALQSCGADPACLKYNVYNFQEDTRSTFEDASSYGAELYNNIIAVHQHLRKQVEKGGVHAVMFSSLTGMSQAMERSTMGRPGGDSGSNKNYSDVGRWKMLAARMVEIQNLFQVDLWHCIWEGHIFKPPPPPMEDKNNPAPRKESMLVSGQAGRQWTLNVEQIFKLSRNFGTKFKQSKIDQCLLDTQPSLDFAVGGRGFNDKLEPREADLTQVYQKLGLKVGNWKASDE